MSADDVAVGSLSNASQELPMPYGRIRPLPSGTLAA